MPVCDSTITGDRIEVQIFDGNVVIPFNLPDWISMLCRPHSGLVDWFVVSLKSNIEHHDSTIVKSYGKQCWIVWMEVQAHDARFSLELVLRPNWVLDCVAAYQACALLQEIIGTITNSEHVLVSRIPLDGSDMFLSGFLG